jgi:hypothetical protein
MVVTLDEAVETATQVANQEAKVEAPEPETPKAAVPAPETPKPAPAPETKPETDETQSNLFLLTPKPGTPAPVKEEIAKEEQDKGYLRQADYTRKTQALADERRAYAEREERLLKLLEARVNPPQREQQGEVTVFERVRQLREDGNHEEADKLVYELARQETRKEIDPIVRNARVQELQSTFVNTAVQTANSDPVVQRYAKTVAARFDGNEVLDARTGLTMADLRASITADRDSMVRFVPVVMRALAMEEHAKALESEMAKTVERRVKEGLAAEQARARRLPGQLVPSSSVARGMAPGGAKMSLDEALSASVEQLTTH